MATKHQCPEFKEKEDKAMAKKGKCPEFREKEAVDVSRCRENLLQ